MDDVQVMQVAKTICRLVQDFLDADQLFQSAWLFAFDVVLKRCRAELHCDIAELPIALGAEISHNILVSVRFSQQRNLTIS